MEIEKLKSLAKIANEIVNDKEVNLSDDLKSIAFEIILKKLIESTTDEKPIPPPESNAKKTRLKTSKKEDESSKKSEYADEILSQNLDKIMKNLKRTNYPQINKLEGAKDLALYVLKIVKDEFEIDGLTSSQIFDILTKKFALEKKAPTSKAISAALKRATKYVELVELKTSFGRGGKTYKAIIVSAGEKYIVRKLVELSENE